MSDVVAEGVLRLRADTKSVAPQVERELGDLGSRAGRSFDDRFGAGIRNVGKKVSTFVTLPLVGGLLAAGKAAADEAQEMNVLAGNVRRATGATEAQIAGIEDYITKTQNATGVTDGKLRPALSRLVLATKDQKLSQDLLNVALDVSVARGLDVEQVATALGRAYGGNVTALGRLGVQTKDAEGKTLSFKQIVDQLSQSMGGSAAEAADTAAGRTAIFRVKMADAVEELGTKAIPMIEKLTGALTGVLDVFSSLPAPAQNIALISVLAVAASGPVLSLVGNVSRLRNSLQDAAGAGRLLGGAIKVTAVVGGILALAQAADLLGKRLDEAFRGRPKIDALTAQLLELGEGGDVQRALRTGRTDVDFLRRSLELLEQGRSTADELGIGKTLDDLDKSLRKIVEGGALGEAKEAVDAIAAALNRPPEAILPFLDDYAAGLEAAAAQTKLTSAAQHEQTAASAAQGEGLEGLADDAEKPKTAFEQLTEVIEGFRTKLDETLGVQLDADAAAIKWQASIDALGESIKENGNKVGFATEKERNLNEALLDTIAAAQAEVEAFARSGRAAADADSQKAALIARLELVKQKFPQLAGPIDNYISTLRSIPSEKSTTVTAHTAQAAADLDAILRRVRDLRNASVSVRAANEVRGAPRQHGGRFYAGQLLMTGEAGREFVAFDRPGYVFKNSDTERIIAALQGQGGSTGVSLTLQPGSSLVALTLAPGTAPDVMRMVPELQRQIEAGVKQALKQVLGGLVTGVGRTA